MRKNTQCLKVSNRAFSDIIAELMWISRETLDRDRLLLDEEYLEKIRRIFDSMGIPVDYLEAEAAYIKNNKGVISDETEKTVRYQETSDCHS